MPKLNEIDIPTNLAWWGSKELVSVSITNSPDSSADFNQSFTSSSELIKNYFSVIMNEKIPKMNLANQDIAEAAELITVIFKFLIPPK